MILIDIAKDLHGAGGQMRLEVALKIEERQFVALAGESGSGKTTLLRILAGLESAEGTIRVGEKLWLDGSSALPPQKREIGFVFQEYALFENMRVEENLLYVRNDRKLADKLLEITELGALKKRLPHTLSGGQKQRVSLCRALMNRPKLLLMDEPLSALDPTMRTKLQQEILTLHREFGTTTIMVSHDPGEIYRLANRVVTIHRGRVVDDGTPGKSLLKTKGSQKFRFEGELLDIIRADIVYVAVVAIGQQLVEVVIDKETAQHLQRGQRVALATKAFAPVLTPL
ncbi:MAG TPA: ATP-binding cassette domain-containing protein [Campylobacteraceae bacterium]|nr:ATP-binding cassette domain-containing protein [Campylobacteraceae bacterium]